MTDTILIIGERAVTAGELVLGLLTLAVLLLIGVILVLRGQARTRMVEAERVTLATQELEERMGEMTRAQAELTGRLQAVGETLGSRQSDLARLMAERLDGMGHRLGQTLDGQTRATMENLGKLAERLAVIDHAQKNITDLAGQVVTLKDVLANKQARGAFGQGRMEALLADGLPRTAYELQATLSNGKRPDALIRLPGDTRALAIDAKFPLESVSLWRDATDADAKRLAGQKLKADLAIHIRDIAEKYLVPGETQDTALMFVPSEGLYADLHEHFDDVVQKAYRARVVIVSPSLLMLAIQVMQQLLKDERMREEATVIRTEVGHLVDDVRRLSERVVALQKHFAQASEDVTQILVSTDKIVKRGGRIGQLDFEEPARAEGVVKLPLKGLGG